MDDTHAPTPPSPRLRVAAGAIAAYFLIQFATAIVAGIALVLAHIASASPGQLQALLRNPHTRILTVVITLPIACALSIGLFRAWFRRQWRDGGNTGIGFRPMRIPGFALHMLLGLATMIAGGMLTLIVSAGHPPVQDIRQIMDQTTLPLRLVLALSAITLVPLAEEILFRGILLPALLRHFPVFAAVTVDAIVFALVHLPDFGWKPQAMLALALLGGVCCWRRLKTGSVLSAVAVHAGNNLVAMVVLLTAAH